MSSHNSSTERPSEVNTSVQGSSNSIGETASSREGYVRLSDVDFNPPSEPVANKKSNPFMLQTATSASRQLGQNGWVVRKDSDPEDGGQSGSDGTATSRAEGYHAHVDPYAASAATQSIGQVFGHQSGNEDKLQEQKPRSLKWEEPDRYPAQSKQAAQRRGSSSSDEGVDPFLKYGHKEYLQNIGVASAKDA